MLALVSLLAGHATPVASLQAQEGVRLTIDAVDSTLFPQVTAYVSVIDGSGLPITAMGSGDFSLSEDSLLIENVSVEELLDSNQPISVVLAIDVSGSMLAASAGDQQTALANTQQAAAAFIETLGPDDQVGLVAFSDHADAIMELSTDKAAVTQAVNNLEAQGETALYDAVVLSVGMLKGLPAGRKAVILLSDGQDTDSTFTFQEAVDEAARWSIPVYPIGFGSVNAEALTKLATLTGGYPQIRPDSTALDEAFLAVRAMFQRQYRVEFTSGLPADGQEHTLIVTLADGSGQTQDIAVFVARPSAVSIVLPALSEGAVITGPIVLNPAVDAAAPIQRVEYLLDGSSLAVIEEAPFDFRWDPQQASPGAHQLVVTATDQAGNTGSITLTVSVQPPVSIQWISPAQGANLTGSPVLEVDARASAGVARVEFYQGTILLATLSAPPYQTRWEADGVEPGRYTLRAVAIDTGGQTAEANVEVNLLSKGTVETQAFSIILPVIIVVLGISALGLVWMAHTRRRAAPIPKASPSSGVGGPEPGPTARLIELEGRNPGQHWVVGSRDVLIGRKQETNDIPAAGRSASRQHAVIRVIGGQFTIVNLNPDNLTIVNGNPINGERSLSPGDEIHIGESRFRFEM